MNLGPLDPYRQNEKDKDLLDAFERTSAKWEMMYRNALNGAGSDLKIAKLIIGGIILLLSIGTIGAYGCEVNDNKAKIEISKNCPKALKLDE